METLSTSPRGPRGGTSILCSWEPQPAAWGGRGCHSPMGERVLLNAVAGTLWDRPV